jgi:ribonuclease-3
MNIEPYQTWARQHLGYEFNDPNLLVTALTHRSYMNEHKKSTREHNERLEFLGDAVLELAVTRFLYLNHDEPEGILTSWRSSLVRTESIGEAGVAIGYEPLLRMSRGEKQGSERARAQILANAFEALIGAIYLDKGYDVAEEFIKDHILIKLGDILRNGSWRDPKSHLQEISQRIDGQTPQYRVVSEDGPDHDKTFQVAVYVDNREIGHGHGTSKQNAQQSAARQAIKWYKKNNPETSKKA